MMTSNLSQVLSDTNFFPRLKEEFKVLNSHIKLKKERILVYFLKGLLRHDENFFESYETIAAETDSCSKTVGRFIRWMNHHGLIRIQSIHGINQTNNYYIRPKGLKFLMTMRYEMQDKWYLFTAVLMKFGHTAKSLWNAIFLQKCPPINKSKAINTSLTLEKNEQKRSASCCLINCEDEECILPRDESVMRIEKLRREEWKQKQSHQRGNSNGGYTYDQRHLGSQDGKEYKPLSTYVEYKDSRDIAIEKAEVNEKYATLDDKKKQWGKLLAFTVSRNEQFKKDI